MYTSIEHISRRQAESRAGVYSTALVSLWDSFMGPAEIQPGWQAVLSLEMATPYHGLSGVQLDDFVYFCEKMHPVCNTLLIHCFKGESRSAALAKWAALRFQVASFDHTYSGYDTVLFGLLCKRHPVPR